MQKVAIAVLQYLFRQYQKGPAILYSINSVTNSYKTDPIAVSEYMLEKKWIREQWVHQNNIVTCRITLEGIKVIDPLFIQHRVRELLNELVKGGGKKSLTEILQIKVDEYAIALDIVYQLESLDFVTFAHEDGNIYIDLTDKGRTYADTQGKSLPPLVLVA